MRYPACVFPLALLLAGPTCAAPLGDANARLLLNRSGFDALPVQIADYAKLEPDVAVSRLLKASPTVAQTTPPEWVNDTQLRPARLKDMNPDEKRELQKQFRQRGIELREWWLTEMLSTPSPLTEHMTLFWHNHFVSSLEKVKAPQLMYRQNVLLRREALGNFGRLLHGIARDPAMLVYLDGARNQKGQPNENFAREVMELFTLGEGHYTEADIREAARAFTGWSINPENGEFLYRPRQHDDGSKTVFGKSGHFDGDDVIDLLLARPETAEFVVTKLWREFVSPEPDSAEVKRLAKLFRDQQYEIKPLMAALFTSPAFYASAGQLTKSPVDLTVGTLREFDVQPPDLRPLLFLNRQLGQDVFAPPNVKGWPGGESWINSQTLSLRQQFLARLFRADTEEGGAMLPPRMKRGFYEPDLASFNDRCPKACAIKALLPLPPDPVPEGDGTAVLRALALDARYQLK